MVAVLAAGCAATNPEPTTTDASTPPAQQDVQGGSDPDGDPGTGPVPIEVIGDPGKDEGNDCLDAFPGQVIFTEVMIAPKAAAAPAGWWIEVLNLGEKELRMRGWELIDGAGGSAPLDLPEGAALPSRGYALIGFEADPEKNGGIEPTVVMEGVTLDSGVLVIMAAETEIDRVTWSADEGWPLEDGRSMSLDPQKLNLLDNDSPGSWCTGRTPFGDWDFGTPGEPNEACAPPPSCGDGEVNAEGEQCDDGKDGDDADGCRDDCTLSCSEPGADCADTPGDCRRPVCVDADEGAVCGGEGDDSDLPDAPGPCQLPSCVAGVPSSSAAEDGALCDDGLDPQGDYCLGGVCVAPACGDGVRGPTEPCDDGGLLAGDGCSPTCELEECGNAVQDPGEECDDGKNGVDSDGCRDSCLFTCSTAEIDCEIADGDCRSAACEAAGLGRLCGYSPDPTDPPDDGDPCTVGSCNDMTPVTAPAVDGTACGESEASGDYCVGGTCQAAVCGDLVQGPLEGCDDGNEDPCDGCLPSCELHTNVCGDGHECAPEQCDDGNQSPGDGCSPLCVIEVPPEPCPADMVLIPGAAGGDGPAAFCVDRFEASRKDATASGEGSDDSEARSAPGVLPWSVRPMSADTLATFTAACAAVGKRLCAKAEWGRACTGPGGLTYVYGNTYEPETCTSVDSFCAEFCEANSVDPCVTTPNCGYTLASSYPDADPPPMHIATTGSMPGCTNEEGHFDIVGNAWEVVLSEDDARGYEIRGGAWNCANAAQRHRCDFNAGWDNLFAGFRCCKDPDE